MPLAHLNLDRCSEVEDLTPLTGMPLTSLSLDGLTKLHDLAPLRGMPLNTLNLIRCTAVEDLRPLKGMKLAKLLVCGPGIRDLEPLKDMPLTSLELHGCNNIRNLRPLRGLPLARLSFANHSGPSVDLSALEGMRLKEIDLPSAATGMRVLLGVHTIDGKPAEEFWKKYQAGEYKERFKK